MSPKTKKDVKAVKKAATKSGVAQRPRAIAKEMAAKESTSKDNISKLNFEIPESKEFLKAGVQFGHQVRRWNPKMKKYIYAQRGDIHIIDIAKTYENLEKALLFLANASARGNILFVGTKRQARDVVRNTAVESGSFFITHRWVGGLLTNFNFLQKSLKKLAKLEKDFETGVQGRTKFEVSRMKKEWERLNRLYEGVKTINSKPTAIVILDSKYEKNVVKEAKVMGIPVIAVVDTNADPDVINYPIPGNDDAVAAINLYFDLFAKAVRQGNEGRGVKHDFKDYTKVEVEIKKVESAGDIEVIDIEAPKVSEEKVPAVAVAKRGGEGILESVQKAKELAQTKK